MRRVRVIHWREAGSGPVLKAVSDAGFAPEIDSDLNGAEVIRAIREAPPDAIVIDLSVRPSHGREIAVYLRGQKATRHIPLVFANGEPDKVSKIRELLPDAHYADLTNLRAELETACAGRPVNPITPPAMMERYREKPVALKLGIAAGGRVGVIDPPRGYLAALGELPPGAEIVEDPETVEAVTLWFVADPEKLLAALRRMRSIANKTRLWMVWRKGGGTGITQNSLREAAKEAGLVDYKICAVGPQWSAMLFARAKA